VRQGWYRSTGYLKVRRGEVDFMSDHKVIKGAQNRNTEKSKCTPKWACYEQWDADHEQKDGTRKHHAGNKEFSEVSSYLHPTDGEEEGEG